MKWHSHLSKSLIFIIENLYHQKNKQIIIIINGKNLYEKKKGKNPAFNAIYNKVKKNPKTEVM